MESLKLQFRPTNAHVKTAQRLTGRSMLQCQIQGAIPYGKVAPSIDARYVATQYQYLKQFVVLNRNETMIVCMDDKAVVPVGDPGMALSTGVRPHNRVLAPTEGPELVAMNHDFCISGLVPYF